jgi:carbonic anhydrase
VRTLIALVAVAAAGCHAARPDSHPAVHWSYEGAEGPDAWGHLAPEFATCAAGTTQSPIDLTATSTTAPTVAFHYHPSSGTSTNNGHTVQVDLTDAGSIELAGTSYRFAQLHFHHPAEHTVDGRAFPLEAHLVHKSAEGRLAVLGILFEEGAAGDRLAPLLGHLPSAHVAQPLAAPFDPATLLPADRALFHYRGSLTTPPCTEGVEWIVLATPATASAGQIAAFAALYEHNARPLQPRNGRSLDASPR